VGKQARERERGARVSLSCVSIFTGTVYLRGRGVRERERGVRERRSAYTLAALAWSLCDWCTSRIARACSRLA
jgi:hypothetical protein